MIPSRSFKMAPKRAVGLPSLMRLPRSLCCDTNVPRNSAASFRRYSSFTHTLRNPSILHHRGQFGPCLNQNNTTPMQLLKLQNIPTLVRNYSSVSESEDSNQQKNGAPSSTSEMPPKEQNKTAAAITPEIHKEYEDKTPITELPVKNRNALKEQVVLLGSGWGGFAFLKHLDLENCDLQVVTPRNHFLFTPLLASACVGTLEFRSIVEPVRKARKDESYNYSAAKCTEIDTENKLLRCRPIYDRSKGDFAIRYDRLVVSVGMDVNTMNVKGAEKYGKFLKELDHARQIRYRIIECFEKATNPRLSIQERAELLNFYAIGGGPTGMELAAEIHDFIKEDLSSLFPELMQEFKLSIIEAGPHVLSMFDKSLQDYTKRHFSRENIKIYTNKKVVELKENGIVLDDGSFFASGLTIWTAGIQSRKLFRQGRVGDLPLDHLKRIIVDDHLNAKGYKGEVYAMGDCATLEDKPLAATAQVAAQQGKYLAQQISKQLAGEPLEEKSSFTYRHRGLMAYIGGYRSITETKDLKLRGRASWVLWRSSYLTMLLSVRNKILVPLDWCKAWFFGRDIMNFKN